MSVATDHSRRRFAVLIAAVALTAAAVPGCGGDSPSSPSAAATVTALGDSITFGTGTTGSNDYVSLLSSRTGVSIVNSGRPGETTASALTRVDAITGRDPDIVIVFLGGNDVLQGVSAAQSTSNITTIVQGIRASGAAVVLVGLGNGPPLDPFNGALPGIASQTGSILVPAVLEGVFGVASLMADAIHPNNAGHAIIADRIEPALRSALAAASR
jgi:lysophospholipase L1-like esterase